MHLIKSLVVRSIKGNPKLDYSKVDFVKFMMSVVYRISERAQNGHNSKNSIYRFDWHY